MARDCGFGRSRLHGSLECYGVSRLLCEIIGWSQMVSLINGVSDQACTNVAKCYEMLQTKMLHVVTFCRVLFFDDPVCDDPVCDPVKSDRSVGSRA
eukprot:1271241-Amphidinium_carterae.1